MYRAIALDEKRVRREAARKIEIVARKNYRARRTCHPGSQRIEAIDLMMQIQMRERFVEQQERCVLAQHRRERDALDWSENLVGDIDHEAR